MQRFRTKVEFIEAEQFNPPHQIPSGVSCYELPEGGWLATINTPSGQMRVSPGGWVTFEDGKPVGYMRPDYFESKYEPTMEWIDSLEACYPELATMSREDLIQALRNELADIHMLEHHCSTVYSHVTRGQVSKATTLPEVVIGIADDFNIRDIDEAVKEELGLVEKAG